jgi:hypothetical protein
MGRMTSAAEPLRLFEPPVEVPPGVVAVCHRCGARSEPIPAWDVTSELERERKRWWYGVAWGLIALKEHEKVCPALVADG